MPRAYVARGRTVATTAAADVAVANIWNPSTAYRLTVYEIWICCNAAPAAGAGIYLRRTTTIGTPGTTVTPSIENHNDRAIAPPSVMTIGMGPYSVQPTFVTAGQLVGWTFAAVPASGIIMPFPRGITIPAGTGLCIATTQAVAIPASDVSVVWEE